MWDNMALKEDLETLRELKERTKRDNQEMSSRVRDIVEKIESGASTGDHLLDFLIVTNNLFDTDNDLYRTLTEFTEDVEANDGI